ncbi:MAG: SRPBCC domain-containing protein [Pseudomonadota bacterium]
MSDTQTMQISADLTKTVFIDAQPEQVWDYLTRKAHIGKWYQPAHGDLRPGAEYALGKDGARTVWGHVLEWDPPRRLVTTFNVEPLEGRETTVTWELSAMAGGTQVTLSHSGIVPEMATKCAILGHLDAGWDAHLALLRGLSG